MKTAVTFAIVFFLEGRGEKPPPQGFTPKEASGKGCLGKVVRKISLQVSWRQVITYEFNVSRDFAEVREIPECSMNEPGGAHCCENRFASVSGGERVFSKFHPPVMLDSQLVQM